jgi:hypothetical protein
MNSFHFGNSSNLGQYKDKGKIIGLILQMLRK